MYTCIYSIIIGGGAILLELVFLFTKIYDFFIISAMHNNGYELYRYIYIVDVVAGNKIVYV